MTSARPAPAICGELLSHVLFKLRGRAFLPTAALMIEYNKGVVVVLGELPQELVRFSRTRGVALWMYVDLRSNRTDSERFRTTQQTAHAVFDILVRCQQDEISRHALEFRPVLRWRRAFPDRFRPSSA